MPETETEDEVVNTRVATAGNHQMRPVVSETVDAETGSTKTTRAGVEEEAVGEGGRPGRKLKESTLKLLEKIEKPIAPHEMGDADEGENPDGDGTADTSAAEGADGEGADEAAAAAEGEGGEEGEGKAKEEEAGVDVVKEWQTKYDHLEAQNRSLVSELEAARATPKSERSPREKALVEAEDSYVNEGSVAALRKFLSVVTGSAPDSKEVDAELSGVYADLTALEVGVPLDENQQAKRDNARTRLLLTRDKRDKAEGSKPSQPEVGDAQQIEQTARYVDNLVMVKDEQNPSVAEECPKLMALAEHFDGMKPGELLARAIKRELQVGTLSPQMTDGQMLRIVARKIEKHYTNIAEKISAHLPKNPDTTKPSAPTQKAAPVKPSQEARPKSHGAPTITNATASAAPAKPPKAKPTQTTTAKTRKDFKSDREWREHLMDKHKIQ